jgi:hypothetical protein
VNRNIGGGATGGTLTTEQKKKLLWGNKKNESADSEVTIFNPLCWCLLCGIYNLSDFLLLVSFFLHCLQTVKNWNNLFMDRERQEKFNKLMVSFLPIKRSFCYQILQLSWDILFRWELNYQIEFMYISSTCNF